MKVNIYEPENVQKGRLMLLNIAEDLKESARIKVAPGGQGEKSDPKKAKKDKKADAGDYEQFKELAEEQAFVKLDAETIEDDVHDEDDDRASYLYMEL